MSTDDARIVRAIGDHFRRARLTLGWTLNDVVGRAAKEGARFSVANLSRFERGLAEFSFMDAYAIARALGTPLNYLEEIVRAAKTRVDVDLKGKSFEKLMESGKRYAKLGENSRAAALFEAAHDQVLLDDASTERDQKLAGVLIWSADAHNRLRHFAMAVDLAARVLDLRGASTEQRASALVKLVHTYTMMGRYQHARIYRSKVGDYWEQMSPKGRAIATLQFGFLELQEENWSEAMALLEEASSDFVGLDDVAHLLLCRANIGLCLGRLGKSDEASKVLRFVVDQAAERRLRSVAWLALCYSGRLLTESGSFEEAREHIETAASIARTRGDQNDLFIAWYLLWRLEIAANRPDREQAARQTLQRLLRKVDSRLPEAAEFVAATVDRRKR